MRTFSVEPQPLEPNRVQPPPSFAAPTQPAPSNAATKPKQESRIAVLGPTLRFKGELSAEEDFILQGRIEGSINHTQSVTIGEQGSCVGNIHARRITIDGTVEGDLHASEAVTVHESGRVTGNIFAPRVGIVEGAYFNGRVEMVRPPAQATKPTPNAEPGVPLTAEETERMMHVS